MQTLSRNSMAALDTPATLLELLTAANVAVSGIAFPVFVLLHACERYVILSL